MSHHIYQTEGVILGGFNVGESNRFLYIFTKDLGLVGVSVQGVRELKSKLRYSLQNLSYTKLDLVRGKQVWRITNAEQVHDLGIVIKNIDKKIVLVNIATLLKRLCVGELVHKDMWEEVLSGLLFLEKEDLTKKELQFFEIILVLKILNYLGYWGDNKIFVPFLQKKDWNIGTLHEMSKFYRIAFHEINSALKESHL